MAEEIKLSEEESPERGGIEFSINDIKKRIETVEHDKETDIQNKLSEREVLIAETKRIDELIKEARSNVEYWDSMKELGELKSQDVEKLKEIENILIFLEGKFQEIKQKIYIISRNPVINEKLQEAAQEEDKMRNKKNIFEKNKKELKQMIAELAEAIKELAPRRGEAFSLDENKFYFPLKRDIDKFIENAKNIYLTKGGSKEEFLNSFEYKYLDENYTEYMARLQKLRKSLGLFKGKEKAAIDYLLSRHSDFENMQQAHERLLKKEKERDKIRNEQNNLRFKYKEITRKYEEVSEASKDVSADWYTYYPSFELNEIMSEYADLKRYSGDQEIGIYKGWRDATSNSETARYLYNTYKDVVGGEL